MNQQRSSQGVRRRQRSSSRNATYRKSIIVAGAIVVVAAISAFAALQLADSKVPQPSPDLPAPGSGDG